MSAADVMDDDDFNGGRRQPPANHDYHFPIPTVIDVHRDVLTDDGDGNDEWSEQQQHYQQPPSYQPYHEQPQLSGQEGRRVDPPAAEVSKEDSSVTSSRDSDGGGYFGLCSPSLKYFTMFVAVMIVIIIVGETSIAKQLSCVTCTIHNPPLTNTSFFIYISSCKL